MKITKSFGDKIYIEWMDAFTEDGWKELKDMISVPLESLCYTNAFYVAHDKEWLIVCHTRGRTAENQMMGKLVIPVKWVRKVK